MFLGCANDDPYYFLEIELAKQKQERELAASSFREVFSENDFLSPLILEVPNSGIFVLDAADEARVRHYNWDFDFVTKIGRGAGQGPGEIGGVSDIHISGDTLYFVDPLNAPIKGKNDPALPVNHGHRDVVFLREDAATGVPCRAILRR